MRGLGKMDGRMSFDSKELLEGNLEIFARISLGFRFSNR